MPRYRSMKTAPKDGSVIEIKARERGAVRAHYWDCGWIRETEPEVADCWKIDDPLEVDNYSDVELEDALGWRPAT